MWPETKSSHVASRDASQKISSLSFTLPLLVSAGFSAPGTSVPGTSAPDISSPDISVPGTLLQIFLLLISLFLVPCSRYFFS